MGKFFVPTRNNHRWSGGHKNVPTYFIDAQHFFHLTPPIRFHPLVMPPPNSGDTPRFKQPGSPVG